MCISSKQTVMASKKQRSSEAPSNEATYECSNKDKPLKRHWYVDTADYGKDYGDWFLSRKDGNWVLQPAVDDGEFPAGSQFLVYTFTASTSPQGLAIMQIQAASYKSTAKDCLAVPEETSSQLDILDLPNNLITDRIGANRRLLEAVSKKQNEELLEGMNTFESIYHRGHYLAYDPSKIKRETKSIPVELIEYKWWHWMKYKRVFNAYDTTSGTDSKKYKRGFTAHKKIGCLH
ncbi:uncharacterized protein [Amphiura filiformis]|uniref:uncharacterized protein n=1 Tax=Amphiura filiformis TaxID=82378 RepID=UPI003B20C89F